MLEGVKVLHHWLSKLVRVDLFSYWSNHAIIDGKKREHLENANWSCTPFTFYILREAATLEILKSCSVYVFVLQMTVTVLLVGPIFNFCCTQHTWWQLIKLSQSFARLLCSSSCAVVLAVPLWSFCGGWDASPRKPPILPLLRSFQLSLFRTACVNYKH